jgi:plasmid replication initiation protein
MEHNSIVRLTNILNFTRQEFDVFEQKLIILILEELRNKQGFGIDIEPNRNLELQFKYSNFEQHTSTARFRTMAEKIITRYIYYEESPDKWSFIVPFIKASYNDGIFKIKINEDVVMYFLELAKGYTNLNKRSVFALTSSHAIRMYELLSAFISEGKWIVELEKLRDYLGIGEKYKNFTDFERYILNYCRKELAINTELNYDWEITSKKRKKVTVLTFLIKTNEAVSKETLNEEIKYTIDYIKELSPADIAQRFYWVSARYTLTQKQLDYILTNKEVFNEFIRIDLIIESMIEKGNPPKDRTKYLAKSLNLDKIKF